eukprot:85221-Amphidinium_carterae.1
MSRKQQSVHAAKQPMSTQRFHESETEKLVGNAVVALMELSGTSVGRPVVVSEAVLFVHAPTAVEAPVVLVLFVHAPTAVEAPIVLLFQPVVAPAVVFAVTPQCKFSAWHSMWH